jgi:hypothetical protein
MMENIIRTEKDKMVKQNKQTITRQYFIFPEKRIDSFSCLSFASDDLCVCVEGAVVFVFVFVFFLKFKRIRTKW